jgi:hypothetical protein
LRYRVHGRFGTVVLAGLVGLIGAGAIGVNAVQVALKPPLIDCPPNTLPDMGESVYHPSQETIARLRQYQAEHRDEYAGEYLASDAIVEAVTGHLDEHRRAYEAILGSPAHLKMMKLRFPESQIKSLMDRISNDMGQLQQNGIRILMISGTGIYQRVELQVSNESTRARAILRERYDTSMLCLIPVPTSAVQPPAYDPNGSLTCYVGGRVDPSQFFSPSALAAPPPSAEQLASDPPGAALRDFLAQDAASPSSVFRDAKDGWKVLSRRPNEVRYGHQRGDRVDYVAVIGQNGGPWKWMGGGDCHPRHPGTTTWHYSVSPANPTVLLITYETGSCDGPADVTKARQVYVDEGSSQVVVAIILSADKPRGGVCAGIGMLLHTEVHLKTPLGSRPLLDGGPVPPQSAELGTNP